jgi:hypothetical protein
MTNPSIVRVQHDYFVWEFMMVGLFFFETTSDKHGGLYKPRDLLCLLSMFNLPTSIFSVRELITKYRSSVENLLKGDKR